VDPSEEERLGEAGGRRFGLAHGEANVFMIRPL
jgi:hypothetical protein